MKVGIFGGTFNPIHRSHIYFADECFEQLGLDQLVLVPNFTPPHKKTVDLASPEDRLTMCLLSIQGKENYWVSDYEIAQHDESYTYETLEHFASLYPEWKMHLLLGNDMYCTLKDWKYPERIFQQAVICGAAREVGEWEKMKAYEKELITLGATSRLIYLVPHPMSSTEIRRRFKEDEQVEEFLYPLVYRYILEKGLYQGGKEHVFTV